VNQQIDTTSQQSPGNEPQKLTEAQQAQAPRTLAQLLKGDSGATTLETALLLAAIALPSYVILQACLGMLVDHYRMTTTLLALPLP
jgi:hypothetical protein